jgi:hypothetical protein
MIKAVLIAAALVLVPFSASSQEGPARKDPEPSASGRSAAPSNSAEQQTQLSLKDSVARAIDMVMDACDDDIEEYCEAVTSGGGRIALCMWAHEDQLSSECRSTLARVSRQLKRNVDRVAEGCLSEIRTLCGEAGKVGPCLEQKKSALSSSCQSIVGGLAQKIPRLMAMTGMPVYSSDNKPLGQVVEVIRGSNGAVQAIQIDIGRALGIGTKLVTITADKLDRPPGLKIFLSESEVRALPEAKKQ